MAEVNEEIVRQYFELQGYFVLPNLTYWPSKKGKKSTGRSDIDLVAYNPAKKEAIIAEVKGWHENKISAGYYKRWNKRLFSFVSPEALERAQKVLGTTEIKKVLVVSRYSEDFKKTAIEKGGVDDVLDFLAIIKEIINKVREEPNKSYKSETLQLIRILDKYDFLEK